ncbi:uncharacterized protein EURHEDRAFT_552283 [Aspergillus ruber CBS 135680]|uniref:Uncharacterized protein n=1 Tax=Aspergillus ruber (strain CBS 135680) TaxID=1388766 RepID=A0A017RZS2_ASPRC|nr:uncharacterized protein EURHEDRAFT_552283 [Aspergillus ruber CBS 135680]EYE90041.1 hypothetical protein EURHEDRAFT_552283 [Aspergillus ruber CBS 135680]
MHPLKLSLGLRLVLSHPCPPTITLMQNRHNCSPQQLHHPHLLLLPRVQWRPPTHQRRKHNACASPNRKLPLATLRPRTDHILLSARDCIVSCSRFIQHDSMSIILWGRLRFHIGGWIGDRVSED